MLTEITEFKKLTEKRKYTLKLQMNVLETVMPIHLDYRSKNEIILQLEKY